MIIPAAVSFHLSSLFSGKKKTFFLIHVLYVERVFSHLQSLKAHQKIHTGVRNYMCLSVRKRLIQIQI